VTPETAIELARASLTTGLLLAGPVLAAGLFVGLSVALLQAVTSVHEMTLTIVPKMLAVAGVLSLLLPWMLRVAGDFTGRILENLPHLCGAL
jgi:flagellar biosynthetic protein FliQ